MLVPLFVGILATILFGWGGSSSSSSSSSPLRWRGVTIYRRDMGDSGGGPLPYDWADIAQGAGLDFASVKVLDGTRRYSDFLADKEGPARAEAHRDLLRTARAVGLSPHGWGYHYLTSPQKAENEGRAAGKAVRALQLDAYHCNAEVQWGKSADPAGNLEAFWRGWTAEAPGVPLFWNLAPGRRLTTSELSVVRSTGIYEPQLYGTRASTVAHKLESAPVDSVWMIGSGRPNTSGSGAWGYWSEHDGSTGMAALIHSRNPQGFNIYNPNWLLRNPSELAKVPR